jgi:hypothetical protein
VPMTKPNAREVPLAELRGDRAEGLEKANLCGIRRDVKKFRELNRCFRLEVMERYLIVDRFAMCLGILPRCRVAKAVGKPKGKLATMIHRKYGRKRKFDKPHFCDWGYFVWLSARMKQSTANRFAPNKRTRNKSRQIQLDY